jgi:RES domain-containing protein
MPRQDPPLTPPEPRLMTVPAGSLLWRLEKRTESGLHPLFRTATPQQQASGRFDPDDHTPVPYCYAATDDLTAIAEVLLRDVTFDGPERVIPRRKVDGRSLSVVEVVESLTMVSLTTLESLAAARQDTWLIHAELRDFRRTRRWGDWLRRATTPPGEENGKPVDGFVWPSKRNPEGRALVVFGDRNDQLARSRHGSVALDDEAGLDWLNRRLSILSTGIAKKKRAR